jgi:hypothetical protein
VHERELLVSQPARTFERGLFRLLLEKELELVVCVLGRLLFFKQRRWRRRRCRWSAIER